MKPGDTLDDALAVLERAVRLKAVAAADADGDDPRQCEHRGTLELDANDCVWCAYQLGRFIGRHEALKEQRDRRRQGPR